MFLKSYGIEKLLDNKVSRFCRLFFLTVPKILWRTLQLFKNFRAPKNILCIIGEFHDFPWKTSSLTVPKNFVGNAFVFQKSSSTEKVHG